MVCEDFAMLVQVLEILSAFFGSIGPKTFVVLDHQLLLGEDVLNGVVAVRLKHLVSPPKIFRATVELKYLLLTASI